MSDLRVELAECGGEDAVKRGAFEWKRSLRMDSKDGQRCDDAAFFVEFNNQPQADWWKLRRQGGRRKEERLGAQFAVEGGIKDLKLQVERVRPLWMWKKPQSGVDSVLQRGSGLQDWRGI